MERRGLLLTQEMDIHATFFCLRGSFPKPNLIYNAVTFNLSSLVKKKGGFDEFAYLLHLVM